VGHLRSLPQGKNLDEVFTSSATPSHWTSTAMRTAVSAFDLYRSLAILAGGVHVQGPAAVRLHGRT
jgi:hypothetical protein